MALSFGNTLFPRQGTQVVEEPEEAIKSSTTKSVSIGSSATQIWAANVKRVSFSIRNESGESIYIGGSGVTTSSGFEIPTGYHYFDDENNAAIYGIVSSGSHDITTYEVEK